MTQSRVCLVSLDPDLLGQDLGWAKVLYEMERVFATASHAQGLDFAIFGPQGVEVPPDLQAQFFPTFTETSDLPYNPGHWPDLWRNSRWVSDQILWSLDRLRSSRGHVPTTYAFLLYNAHPGHIAALIRLGLALRGESPIVLNLYHLHFMNCPGVAFTAGPPLRELLRATRGLRRAANVHLRVDSQRLADLLERETGERFEVLPFFSFLGDGPAPLTPRDASRPVRVVYPTAAPSGGKGADLVLALAERLQRDDVEIIAREPGLGTPEICLPPLTALRGPLRYADAFMPGSRYLELVRSSDIVLVPYRHWQFSARTSGVVADAIRLGKPMVGTADSWIGDQIEATGLGTTFRDGDVDSFVAAVERAVEQVRRPGSGSNERRTAWLAQNTQAALIQAVVGAGRRRRRLSEPAQSIRLLQFAFTTRALLPGRAACIEQLNSLRRWWRGIIGGSSGTVELFTDAEGLSGRYDVFNRIPALQWKTRGVERVELRLDQPDGFLVERGGPSGEISATIWIDDRRWIYLQDASDGSSTGADKTLGRVRYLYQSSLRPRPFEYSVPAAQRWLPLIRLRRRARGLGLGSLTIDAPRIGHVSQVEATVTWTVPEGTDTAIWIGSVGGDLFAAGNGSGTKQTGPWVMRQTTFYLIDTSPGVPDGLRLLDVRAGEQAPVRYPIDRTVRTLQRLAQRHGLTAPSVETRPRSSSVPSVDESKLPVADAIIEGEWGIVPPISTGELFLLARYSRAFLDRYGGTRIVALVPRAYVALLKLFPDAPIVGVDRSRYDVSVLDSGVQQGRVIKLVYGPFVGLPYQPVLGRHQDEHSGYAPLFVAEVGLSLDAPAIHAQVTPELRDSARRIFRELGLIEGRSVILAPVAYSIQSTTPPCWNRLVAALQQRGFTVATNCGPNESPLEGTVAFRGDLGELYAAIELAGSLITARSGLCDICCESSATVHILMRDTIYLPMPGIRIEPRLSENGLPDTAVYHTQRRDEDPLAFAERVLAHPTLS